MLRLDKYITWDILTNSNHPGLPWLRSTNLMINWSVLSLTLKIGPRSTLPSLAFAQGCSTATLHHEDIIPDHSPAFDSIPELCTSSGPLILTKVVPGPDLKINVFCQVGAVLIKLCSPSWIYTLEPTQIRPTQTHALVGSVVTLVFCIRQILSDFGWGPHPSYDPFLDMGRSC